MNKFLSFGASWCGPCKSYKPTLLQLDQDYITYYDVDTALQERAEYDIKAIPTLVLVDEFGVELDRLVGVQPLSKLQNLLK